MFRQASRLVAVAVTTCFVSSAFAQNTSSFEAACTALSTTNSSSLSSLNTTIFNATWYADATVNVEALGVCQTTANISVPVCRAQFYVNTSDVSAITAEMWLPTNYSGRLLAIGNGGLAGCIDYINIDYGASKGFATVSSNNGHDGDTGIPFANNTEVLLDFTTRSIHLENVVGKQIIENFYGAAPNRSYYLGCSTGGRQGMYSAFNFPDDFDGILAGSPAINFNNFLGAMGMWTVFFNQTSNNASFISEGQWELVYNETMKQCDGIDGVMDGIITEPDACDFRPEQLQCGSSSTNSSNCLSKGQVAGLKQLYRPLYGIGGNWLFPAYELGVDTTIQFEDIFDTSLFRYPEDWMKYVVLNDSNYDVSTFGLEAVAQMDALDPFNVSTWDGDFTPFINKGGKIISYHGRADPYIPSASSKSFYNNAAFNLAMNSEQMDSFYRLFLVPGMGHCFGGVGEGNFGQGGIAVAENPSASNVLDDLIDWVENGVAPETIVGASEDGLSLRTHCRYPQRSVYDGTEFVCTTAEDT